MDTSTTGYTEAAYGRVSVLLGAQRGAYPFGNSLLVRGSTASLVVDPSLSLVGNAPQADLVLVSHAHEDHIAGLGDYGVPVHVHEHELDTLRSPESMVDGYGLTSEIDLTSFGPYYGDVGSSLESFEASVRRCRDIDAR